MPGRLPGTVAAADGPSGRKVEFAACVDYESNVVADAVAKDAGS